MEKERILALSDSIHAEITEKLIPEHLKRGYSIYKYTDKGIFWYDSSDKEYHKIQVKTKPT